MSDTYIRCFLERLINEDDSISKPGNIEVDTFLRELMVDCKYDPEKTNIKIKEQLAIVLRNKFMAMPLIISLFANKKNHFAQIVQQQVAEYMWPWQRYIDKFLFTLSSQNLSERLEVVRSRRSSLAS